MVKRADPTSLVSLSVSFSSAIQHSETLFLDLDILFCCQILINIRLWHYYQVVSNFLTLLPYLRFLLVGPESPMFDILAQSGF